MRFTRFMLSLGLATATAVSATATWAQNFPNKPVRILVGFTPGGGTDALARMLGAKLNERWGQSVLVENRPGADGDIALETMLRTPADGYTLTLASNAYTIAPVQRKVSYDPLKSFTAIQQVAISPGLLVVRATLPVNNLKELIAYARANPGKLNFGSTGVGTTPYLQMALLMKLTGTEMVSVPFKGTPIGAMVAGDVDLGFSAIPASMSMVKAGKLKAFGVSTKNRSTQMPDVPTVAEQGFPGFDAATWYSVLGPAGIPRDIVNKLHADFSWAGRDPTVAPRMNDMGFVSVFAGPEELMEVMKGDLARWGDLMKSIKVVQ